MRFFNKQRPEGLPPLITDDELEQLAGVNYDTVLDWLVGLSAADYAKMLEVAKIYRKANADAAKSLGVAEQVTTYINNPADSLQTIEPVFLETPEKPTKKGKASK